MIDSFLAWLNDASLLTLGTLLLVCMMAAGLAGYASRRYNDRSDPASDTEKRFDGGESYIVSAVLGLLALLLGFTFSLATERFEARRLLVMEETNAIGTAYLRAQLLDEPHRARLSQLLIVYTENKIALAKAKPRTGWALLAVDDRLLTDIWAATAAAFDSIKHLDFSSAFVGSINRMIDLDATRRAARQTQVPTVVFAVLLIYMVVTAGVLGYVLSASRGRYAAGLLLLLLTMSLMLIIDIDRPTTGGINESQRPMEQLLKSLKSQPVTAYDRWRTQPGSP
jgi:hypothetical protein